MLLECIFVNGARGSRQGAKRGVTPILRAQVQFDFVYVLSFIAALFEPRPKGAQGTRAVLEHCHLSAKKQEQYFSEKQEKTYTVLIGLSCLFCFRREGGDVWGALLVLGLIL